MKIALLNDTHFGCRNDSPHFVQYQERFYNEVFFPYIKEFMKPYIKKLDERKEKWKKEVEKFPSYHDFLLENYYK